MLCCPEAWLDIDIDTQPGICGSTPLSIDREMTPLGLTKLTGGGSTDPRDDATIRCQLSANQRPGSGHVIRLDQSEAG